MAGKIDWAAWVSAVGGLASVGATAYIAVFQTRRANNIEDQAVELERVHRNALIDEAQRIAMQIVELHKRCIEKVRPTGEIIGWTYAYDDYQAALEVECDRLITLQQFAIANVAIYTAIERIARTSRLPRRNSQTGQGMVSLTSHRIAEATTKLSEEFDRYR